MFSTRDPFRHLYTFHYVGGCIHGYGKLNDRTSQRQNGIDESYTITLAAGSEINWSASTTLTGAATTTPEPNSLALAGLGLLGFSLLLKRVHLQA